MSAVAVGGAQGFQTAALVTNAISADGSSVIFASPDPADGDADGVAEDLYRRVMTPGAEETVLLTDVPGVAAPRNALFRWASPDHDRLVWATAEMVSATGDTDDAQDLYLKTGAGAPVRVTQGEEVGGVPTGNADGAVGDAEWVATSDDAGRVYFVSREQLTADAPSDTSEYKLYERDVAAGRTSFVAGPLAEEDVDLLNGAVGSLKAFAGRNASMSGIRVTPGGVAFQSAAPLDGDADGGLRDVFAWSPATGLEPLSTPAAGAPVSPPAAASIIMLNPSPFREFAPIEGGLAVASTGAVFFTTAESLTAGDTDGGRQDVYVRSGGGLTLVSPPGDAPYDATFVDSSPDGTRVYLQTRETILPTDTDANFVDTYLAILGGGSSPGTPAPDPMPAGPIGPAGPPEGLPADPVPASEAPKTPTPPPPSVPRPPADDPAGQAERTELTVRPGRRVRQGGVAVLRIDASAAGRLRVRAEARLRRNGRMRTTRIGAETVRVGEGAEAIRIRLSRRAVRRLEHRAALKVRFTVRLVPSGAGRPVTDRMTVKLRSGDRR